MIRVYSVRTFSGYCTEEVTLLMEVTRVIKLPGHASERACLGK